ncbi:hypothetical protein Tco_0978392 [Tanacetum coccineum]|uniref:Uncharacterized protein n=1 Tax=Tanacetum coccineum TaxID=301880 RepID=A0ABQ5EMY6_9ASTR
MRILENTPSHSNFHDVGFRFCVISSYLESISKFDRADSNVIAVLFRHEVSELSHSYNIYVKACPVCLERKDLPRIRGTRGSASKSTTTKSAGNLNFSTFSSEEKAFLITDNGLRFMLGKESAAWLASLTFWENHRVIKKIFARVSKFSGNLLGIRALKGVNNGLRICTMRLNLDASECWRLGSFLFGTSIISMEACILCHLGSFHYFRRSRSRGIRGSLISNTASGGNTSNLPSVLVISLVLLNERKTGRSNLISNRGSITGISLIEISCGCLGNIFLNIVTINVAIVGETISEENLLDEFQNKIIPCENRSRGFFFKPNPGCTLERKWEKHKLYRRTRDVRELHRRSDLVEITDVSMRVFFVMSEELFVLNEGKQTMLKLKVVRGDLGHNDGIPRTHGGCFIAN